MAELELVRPVKRAFKWFIVWASVFCLAGCATDRSAWSLAHAYISPRARQLPHAELEEIVTLVSRAWGDTIIGVGQACGEPQDVMHAVANYDEDRVMVFDLKKISGPLADR